MANAQASTDSSHVAVANFAASQLIGKVAVVIGGSGGIGAAICRSLAAAGAQVAVVSGRSSARAQAVAASLPGDGHGSYAVDVSDSAALRSLAELVIVRHARVDILVNSAGITSPVPHSDLDGLTDALFSQVMEINCRGPFAASRAFVPHLRTSGDALIINISSIAATTGVGSNIAYCASKAGLDIMGVALAKALAPEIRVLTVSPGVVDTNFVPGRDQAWGEKQAASTPLRRLTSPEDVAAAVLACATTLTFSTGSVIQVDGGRHL